jgi:hypothetical protein
MHEAANRVEPFDRRIGSVGRNDDLALRQPVSKHAKQLVGALEQRDVFSAPARIVALGWRQHRKDRQRPGALGPGDARDQHQAQPPQPACLDEVRLGAADRVAVDASGCKA